MKAPLRRNVTRIRAKNFQAHADTEFYLTPGLNLICGTSNAGKSALLRAIDLAMSNEVPNSEFVRWDCENAEVEIEYDDGIVVERVKGKRNDVFVHYPDGHPDTPLGGGPFAARNFGTEYPPAVLKALGYPPSTERLGSIWYADQHSAPFLVGLKPTELPRALSEITDLSNLEASAKKLSTLSKQQAAAAKDAQKLADKAQGELSAYDDLEERLQKHAAIEAGFDQIEDRWMKVERAKALHAGWKSLDDECLRLDGEVAQCSSVLQLAPQITALSIRTQRINAALDLAERVSEADREAEELTNELTTLQAVLKAISPSVVGALTNRLSVVIEALDLHRRWSDINEEGRRTNGEYVQATAEVAQAKAQLDAYRRAAIESGAICAACGQVAVAA